MWFRKSENDIEMSGMMEPKPKKKHQEIDDTDYQPVDWKKVFLSPKYLPWHILFILIGIATVLITIRHDEVVAVSPSSLLSMPAVACCCSIVISFLIPLVFPLANKQPPNPQKLRPFSEKVRDLPAGWLIPIAILIIISFPPLFGHEVIALLCGVVYGLWIGFAIVAAGTFIGEIGTWFAFKHLFRRKAHKMERTNLNYGAMARLTRDGGFLIVLIIRLSAIPAHFSTAVFSTCDVKFWHFVVATFASLPKQIFLVYLGVLLVKESDDSVIKTVMFGLVFVITVAMGVWIYMKMRNIKKILIEEQELRRVKRAEAVELVPNVKSAFERPYAEGPVVREEDEELARYDEGPSDLGERRYYAAAQRGTARRYEEEAGEWTMAPTQPTRMI
ncbi:hypothetical protein T440DRAFT_533528 [Plenodomus tracheiphilus IPT5]|uniref:Golgi apparatus membrane protein TVP38 n=1 Tax=Plenodomus tracheiphilus IPT5 TaxID=1408161 RepID=A0A6A7B1R9_9PLEO|nr:hypothetical protein T440DRAFT_533528 [Plenodomus tracheiphilus IPT5]